MKKRGALLSEKLLVQEIHKTPPEYWPNLLELIRIFRESVMLNPSDDSFRQGWKEAMSGLTYPVSKLWDDIDAT